MGNDEEECNRQIQNDYHKNCQQLLELKFLDD